MIDNVSAPSWLAEMPQPLRWAVVGAVLLAVVGAIYGIVESIRDYPLGSWFGVTLYVAMIGAAAGFVLGLATGAVRRLLRGAPTP